MTPMLLRRAACFLLVIPAGLVAQTSLPKQSPFSPSGAAGANQVAANETLEFAGVSSVGKKTDVIIFDKATKRKHWIPIGETIEGISVVRYDASRDLAIVKVNGAEKVLPLRKATRSAPGPAPVAPVQMGFNVPPPATTPAPAATQVAAPPPTQVAMAEPVPATQPAPVAPTPAPQTPEAHAKAETEARMLVSDLLEIGMAQRKAYEEAQRKAAAGATAGQPAQPPAPGQTPPTAGETQTPPAAAQPGAP